MSPLPIPLPPYIAGRRDLWPWWRDAVNAVRLAASGAEPTTILGCPHCGTTARGRAGMAQHLRHKHGLAA